MNFQDENKIIIINLIQCFAIPLPGAEKTFMQVCVHIIADTVLSMSEEREGRDNMFNKETKTDLAKGKRAYGRG